MDLATFPALASKVLTQTSEKEKAQRRSETILPATFWHDRTRTAIEQYDYDSTWSRWRRGMEYYFQGAYLDFADTDAVLYQGTEYEIPVLFDGYRFATKNADSRTHYTIRRSVRQTSN